MFWGARERLGALQPLKKHWNSLSFCMPALYGGFLVNSMKFIENQEFNGNVKNHGNHVIWRNSLIFWIPRPFTKPYDFRAQNQGLRGLDLRKPKKPQKLLFSMNSPKFHHFPQNSWKILKMMQNHFLEDSGGSLAATCWKHWYSYRNIEVFELPGRTRNAPKPKKWWNFLQNMKIPHKSWNFCEFHEIS